ncbi:MAG: hypothetical protein JWP35_4677 [Caulobacter sp.]|nr:hypothetical protein [Caulobacter sp.]
MTISAQPTPKTYTCAGTTGPYGFPYRFLTTADLLVTRISAGGVRTGLDLGADYSVSGAGDNAGGAVSTVASYADGQIEVWLAVEETQNTAYTPGDPFPANAHESALDKLTLLSAMRRQEIGDVASDLFALQEQVDAVPTLAAGLSVVQIAASTGSYDHDAHCSRLLSFTVACVFTLPLDAPKGAYFSWEQAGSGLVQFLFPDGTTKPRNRLGYNKSAGQEAAGSMWVRSNPDAASADWVLTGDVGA